LSVLETTEIYQQLLIISADKEVLEDRAVRERAVKASGAEVASFNLIETSLLREVEEKEIADIQSLAEIAQEQEKSDEAAVVTAAALKSTEKHRVKAQQKAVKRDIAQQKADEAAATTAAVLKSTEEHRVPVQQKAEERDMAEKKAAEKQKAEEAEAKASAHAAAVKKLSEEKSALAAFEMDRKKKDIEKADAKRTAGKQADETA